MTAPDALATYRYVSDGELARRVTRERWARLRNPLVLVHFVAAGLALGVVASLTSNAASLPAYLGRVLLIGVVWGAGWLVVVALLTVALLGPLARLRERQVDRQYPEGSVTAVALGAEELVIARPSGIRTDVPYRAVARVRRYGSLLAIQSRGRLMPELLPQELLPDEAIEFVHARVRGTWPVVDREAGEPTRSFVVPPGWAAHAAAVFTAGTLRRRGFLVRLAVAVLLSVLLALAVGRGWALVGPALMTVVAALTFARTHRGMARALPSGSVATTEFLEDRFISRNAGGAREIRYADISSLEIRGDVVVLTFLTTRSRLVIARALIPADVLERLHR